MSESITYYTDTGISYTSCYSYENYCIETSPPLLVISEITFKITFFKVCTCSYCICFTRSPLRINAVPILKPGVHQALKSMEDIRLHHPTSCNCAWMNVCYSQSSKFLFFFSFKCGYPGVFVATSALENSQTKLL